MKMTIRIPIQVIVILYALYFALTENVCIEIKKQQSIFYDIYVENAIGVCKWFMKEKGGHLIIVSL